MSHNIDVTVAPTDVTDMPHARLGGTQHDIPILRFADSRYARNVVSIHLGNHPDPVAYLTALATAAQELADDYAAAQAAVSA